MYRFVFQYLMRGIAFEYNPLINIIVVLILPIAWKVFALLLQHWLDN